MTASQSETWRVPGTPLPGAILLPMVFCTLKAVSPDLTSETLRTVIYVISHLGESLAQPKDTRYETVIQERSGRDATVTGILATFKNQCKSLRRSGLRNTGANPNARSGVVTVHDLRTTAKICNSNAGRCTGVRGKD